jgi:hypothetical protein
MKGLLLAGILILIIFGLRSCKLPNQIIEEDKQTVDKLLRKI